jgi:hypothetical protein
MATQAPARRGRRRRVRRPQGPLRRRLGPSLACRRIAASETEAPRRMSGGAAEPYPGRRHRRRHGRRLRADPRAPTHRGPRPRRQPLGRWLRIYGSTFSRTVWRLYGGAKGLVMWYYDVLWRQKPTCAAAGAARFVPPGPGACLGLGRVVTLHRRSSASLYDSTFSRTVWRLYGGAKGLVMWYYGSVVLSLCTAAHPLCTRFARRISASVSVTTVRPSPSRHACPGAGAGRLVPPGRS